jgi:predicted phosphate transport protein (TIGR00153 family)
MRRYVMARSIIPRDEAFFDYFDRVGTKLVEAAECLKRMLEEGGSYEEHARRIKAIESESDELVHHLIERLHKTFVTPLDRQDIYKLAVRLDDILDLTDASSSRIDLYRPKEVMQEALDLARIILQSTKQVSEMIGLLRNLKKQSAHILKLAVEIDRLENDADHIRRIAIARLFRDEGDAKELIKWKDILEHMEAATDCCEDVSDIIEGIVMEST